MPGIEELLNPVDGKTGAESEKSNQAEEQETSVQEQKTPPQEEVTPSQEEQSAKTLTQEEEEENYFGQLYEAMYGTPAEEVKDLDSFKSMVQQRAQESLPQDPHLRAIIEKGYTLEEYYEAMRTVGQIQEKDDIATVEEHYIQSFLGKAEPETEEEAKQVKNIKEMLKDRLEDEEWVKLESERIKQSQQRQVTDIDQVIAQNREALVSQRKAAYDEALTEQYTKVKDFFSSDSDYEGFKVSEASEFPEFYKEMLELKEEEGRYYNKFDKLVTDPQASQRLLFLHYLDTNGFFKDLKFNTRSKVTKEVLEKVLSSTHFKSPNNRNSAKADPFESYKKS